MESTRPRKRTAAPAKHICKLAEDRAVADAAADGVVEVVADAEADAAAAAVEMAAAEKPDNALGIKER